jgi:DNA-binding transcriptional LysR family regulator
LSQVFEWQVVDDLASGRLQRALDAWQAPFAGWYVYYPAREHMAQKLRVFIDYLRERWGNQPIGVHS